MSAAMTMSDLQPYLAAVLKYGPSVVLGLLLLFLSYAKFVYNVWELHFGRKRVSRRQFVSPSNQQPPDVKTFEENKENVLRSADKHPVNFDTCELLHPLAKNMPKKQREAAQAEARRKAKRINSLTPASSRRLIKDAAEASRRVLKFSDSTVAGESTVGSLSNEKAKELDMDHVYLTYTELLWAYCFIGPNAYFLWLKGVLILWVRVKLQKLGLLKPKPFDPAEVVGRLCLEGTLAVHYYARTDADSEIGNIAGFFFHSFPYIDRDCVSRVADIFAVDVDLDTKKMVKAKFNDQTISASSALILLWFNTISGNHVKLHALANWGVNTEIEVRDTNPFLAQNSLVTVVYNFFGFTCFANYIPTWVSMGLMSKHWRPNALVEVFQHGIKDNIWSHPNIDELIPHSDLVKFVTRMRNVFLNEFAKHREDFPGIHGEAMFVGTVLHSLDHTCMDWNLEDALWLDVDDPQFGIMAELGRIVKVGFIEDVPGLMFHKRFKGSKHPFYKTVYEKGVRINKKYADVMDTCIIK